MKRPFTKDTEIFLFCKSISTLTGADLYNVQLFAALYKLGYKVNLIWADINPNDAFQANLNYFRRFLKPLTSVTVNEHKPFMGSLNDFFKHNSSLFGVLIPPYKSQETPSYSSKIKNLIEDSSVWICSNNHVLDVIFNVLYDARIPFEVPFSIDNIYQIVHHEFYPEERPHERVLTQNLLSCRDMPHYGTHCIGNPIDVTVYGTPNLTYYKSRKIISMIGSIDAYRYPLLKRMAEIKMDTVVAIGRNDYSKLPNALYLTEGSENVINLYKQSKVVFGVFNGRTKLEAWANGIPYVNFDPNNQLGSCYLEFPPFVDIPKELYFEFCFDQDVFNSTALYNLGKIDLLKYFHLGKYQEYITSISATTVAKNLISYLEK